MQHLINITVGNPKMAEQYQLTKEFDVVWFFIEDGKNWYEEQKYFVDDTIKTTYDKDNIIRYVERGVTAIRPDGLSAVEAPDTTTNRRADIPGNWMFKDGTVTKRIYMAEELQQQIEIWKVRPLVDAESVILSPERAVRLNMVTEEEHS